VAVAVTEAVAAADAEAAAVVAGAEDGDKHR